MSAFWKGRRVLVTGQTGFKGAWLVLWLERLGAEVSAFALAPETQPSLYDLAGPWTKQQHSVVDIRDELAVKMKLQDCQPEIVFHLAAKALVRPSYEEPVETFATNVMGTINLLDAIRQTNSVRAAVIITTDKVYENKNHGLPFVETDRLGGKDPYSGSKACAELAVRSYGDSFFFNADQCAVATTRAGNVVGGGDWSVDRLIPDILRARSAGRKVVLRYPEAVRPWQHVLEPLSGYLTLAKRLIDQPCDTPHAFNFGPNPDSFLTVSQVVDIMTEAFDGKPGWEADDGEHLPEAATLTLDSTLAKEQLAWSPVLSMAETIKWTAQWYRDADNGGNARILTGEQISRYEGLLDQDKSGTHE